MTHRRLLIAFGLAALFAVPAPLAGQGNPTGTIAGRVVSLDGLSLPGVTVVAQSPALQGVREAVTSANGDYLLAFLPPGQYTVTFSLEGFTTLRQEASVAAAQSVPVDVRLELAGVTETVVVVGMTTDVLTQTATTATTFRKEAVDTLPLTRTSLDFAAALVPGVTRSGPSSTTTGLAALSISGAASFENLVLVNGAIVQDNVRRGSIPLFIEDAIQETTVVTSAISAEFGRFAGGVVNAITKSGGNRFSGSFRTTFDNDSWRAVSPFGESRSNTVIPTYEFTLGGPVLRDRIWFFGAGRLRESTTSQTTAAPARLPFERTQSDNRFEGKVTWTAFTGHTLKAAYLDRRGKQTNAGFEQVLDLRSLSNREDPEDLRSINYTGIFGGRFFIEAQYSQRHAVIARGFGATSTDLVEGTLVIDNVSGARYNSPTFCGICRDENRDNANWMVKGSYFLSTPRFGSHTFVAGFDSFNDELASENHQSGSGYRILGTSSVVRDGVPYPVWQNVGSATLIRWNPIFAATKGSQFRTHSFFVNDQWRLSDRLSFNLGLRYDKNDGTDSAGAPAVDDAKWSPRLSTTWDPRGNGRWTVNASYATYVSAIVNGIANAGSNAGSPARFDYQYLGPAINTDPSQPLVSTEDALRILFDWFFANGGTNRPTTFAGLPGVNFRVADTLNSPSVNEIAGGASRRLGARGIVRADLVYRDFRDFYATRVDPSTGQVRNDLGQTFDMRVVENTNEMERQYVGLSTSLAYRLGERLSVGGAYTLSRTRGNVDGETSASGPVTVGPQFYPEYSELRWNDPVGGLATDQRHKTRLWASWMVPLAERWGTLTLGVIQAADSGQPYNARGTVNVSRYVTPTGYQTPPATATYFFTERDAFRTEASTQTDLAVTYGYRIGGRSGVELFAKADVQNLFNQAAIVNPQFLNQGVLTNNNAPTQLAAFDPFLETPQRGVHWELNPAFGTPTSRFAYQFPRLFRVAVGVRF